MENYTVDLSPSTDKVESFEENDENILMVRVQLPSGEMIEGKGYRVEVTLSKDGMLALGTALIRGACIADEQTKVWHLHPAIPELVSEDAGVFLHPRSCELLLSQRDFENIHTIVAKAYPKDG